MADKVIFPEDEPGPRSSRRVGKHQLGRIKSFFSSTFALVAAVVLASWLAYTSFRIDVGTGEMAILIRKTGLDMQNGSEIAETAEHKGVQREYLTEGRYFRSPIDYEWKVISQEVIAEGEVGVLVSLTGDDLPYGEFLAHVDENGEPTTKGIMPSVLKPGRYPVHPYLYSLERHAPVVIPAGFKGVVTNLAGPLPKEPNTLLVEDGMRGVQNKVLDAGTNYINPYETRISLVDCRSQRFNLAENKDMGFPSKDGFWVSLDGIIEFRVKPEHAAEVYVTYNEESNGDAIDEEIVRKIIMPNARSFCRLQGSNELGRDLIGGETRIKFQEDFQDAMRRECDPLGIEIIQALITRIHPPEQIASLVQQREIAKQEEKQYQQQILQQESEQKLKVEEEMANQKQEKVVTDQQVVVVTTEALKKQEVDLTEANQRLKVAELKLEAAKDEAAAVVARGKAEAEVIKLTNAAEAAGWKRSVEAFDGDGMQYARFIMYQKLSTAYRKLMINTADSPIMKVFEGFAPGSDQGVLSPRVPVGAESTAGAPPAETPATP